MDIEFATNKELIKELTSRHNFVGIIVSSTHENRNGSEVHNDFELRTMMGRKNTASILKKIVSQLESVS